MKLDLSEKFLATIFFVLVIVGTFWCIQAVTLRGPTPEPPRDRLIREAESVRWKERYLFWRSHGEGPDRSADMATLICPRALEE